MRGRPIEERLAYLGLDEEAFEELRALRPLFEEHADALAEQFYRELLSYEELRPLFRDEQTRRHFLRSRSHYLRSLADSDFGPDYVETRRRSARLQEGWNLPPAWITRLAMLHMKLLVPVLMTHFGPDFQRAARVGPVVGARLALDVEIAVESYMECREEGLSFMAGELASERHKLQDALREQGATLRETSERARAAEELASIATLVAGLAHEIGTPMSVIQGHAKMLERSVGSEDEDGVWRLRTIQEQIARISRIIHTLLKIAHPRRWNHEDVALAALIDQSLSFVSEKLGRRGIEVRHDLDRDVRILGDRERLQQLLLNLLLNAADAMPGGGELVVQLARTGDRACIRVADDGAGIRPADLPRIFEPFFTTKEAGHGNGLGLMVCKGIVADHGGEIEVESELRRGTVFSITLPCTKPAEPSGV